MNPFSEEVTLLAVAATIAALALTLPAATAAGIALIVHRRRQAARKRA